MMIVWRITEKIIRTVLLRQLCTMIGTHMSSSYSVVLALFVFVVLDLVSSILRHEIGWEERLRNDLVCVEWDVKP